MTRLRIILPLLLLSASFTVASPPEKTLSFWRRVINFLGVSSSPDNQKGTSDLVNEGDINIYNVETKVGSTLRQGRFRSPVFLSTDRTILALSGDKVVKFNITIAGTEITAGAPTELFTIPGIRKLVGIEKNTPGQVLILTDIGNDKCSAVGVLSLRDGTVINLPYGHGEEDKDLVSYLSDWKRDYDNDQTKLKIDLVTKKKNGEDVKATDAFLKLKDKDWVNVSRCAAGVNCGQPSISNNRRFVLFVGKI